MAYLLHFPGRRALIEPESDRESDGEAEAAEVEPGKTGLDVLMASSRKRDNEKDVGAGTRRKIRKIMRCEKKKKRTTYYSCNSVCVFHIRMYAGR